MSSSEIAKQILKLVHEVVSANMYINIIVRTAMLFNENRARGPKRDADGWMCMLWG